MNEVTATDDILTLFRDAWNLQANALLGYTPDVEWPGVVQTGEHDKARCWARVEVLHNNSAQTGLGGGTNRMFTRFGLIIVQVFAPRDLLLAQQLAIIARNAFEGFHSPNGVWFRNGRVNEVGPSESWYQTNCIVEFQFDEIK